MEFSLEEFVSWMLLGSMGLVGVFTMISRASRRSVEKQAVRRRIICRLCQHSFEDSGSHTLAECPTCHAVNERGRDRRLG